MRVQGKMEGGLASLVDPDDLPYTPEVTRDLFIWCLLGYETQINPVLHDDYTVGYDL